MTRGRNCEAAHTPGIMRGFAMAGCSALYKIPDPPKSHAQKATKRPCDFIGVMPDGRALRCEVKAAKASHKGVLGFGPSQFRPHQLAHLAAVAKNGGRAVVALVSFWPGLSWKLYLWRWSEFARVTNAGQTDPRMWKQISAEDMRKLPSLCRLSEGKKHYWDVSQFVSNWTTERQTDVTQ